MSGGAPDGGNAAPAAADLLRRAQGQLMRAMAPGAEVIASPGFRIFIWPSEDLFYRNVAVPIARPPAWPDAIARMVAVFRSMHRQPRLELFAELWPDLPAALAQAGFACEQQAPAMALERRAEPPPPPALPVVFLDAAAPERLLAAFLALQGHVFHPLAPPLGAIERRRLRTALRRGETMAAAVMEGEAAVAVASLVGIGAEAELAGVATRVDRRRLGLGLGLCRALLGRYLGTGGELVWLSAGGPGSGGLYRKLGFRPIGTQLNFVLPDDPGPRSHAEWQDGPDRIV